MPRGDAVKVGVIGVGWFGEFHARVYSQLANARLVGVCDANLERARAVAGRLQVPVYTTPEQLLAESGATAVSICTTDQMHLAPTMAACNEGKHVLLEKPMALDLGECDQMILAAKKAGVQLMVGHVLRFNQRYAAAYAEIAGGRIGTVRHFYGRRSNPRRAARRLGARCGYHTIVFHNAVHDLDIMNWFGGGEVIEAYAVSQSGEMVAEGYEMSDTVLSVIRFRSGAVALLENCWIYPDTYPTMVDGRTEVTGTTGRIVLDLGNQGGVSFTASGIEYLENPHWPEIHGQVGGDLREELETFIRCVADGTPVPVTGEDGRKAVAGALAIVGSLETGKPHLASN